MEYLSSSTVRTNTMAATPRSSFHGTAAAMFLLLLFSLLAALAPTTVATSPSAVSSGGGGMQLNSSCIAAERDALLAFKAGITSDPSRRLRSWRGQDCCRWYGVKCSSRTGHVVKLDLHNDFFDDDYESFGDDHVVHWLRGQISSSLLSLRHLKHLDLSGNLLGGNMSIPMFMGSLNSLTYLDLSNMNFIGRVPPQLGNLTNLVHLNMNNFLLAFFAYSYSSDVSWLASLHLLEHLDMSGVNLSTAVDWVHAFNTLPNLRVLYLSLCELNSSIPSLQHHNHTVLEELDLSRNPFDSPVAPNWYWEVTTLKSLSISGCGFSGPFPDELGNLTMLHTLDTGWNNIEGMIPSTLKNLCSLEVVYLASNNIGGDIANLIERLPNCSWSSLQELYLFDVNITGMTLKSVLNLTSLSLLFIQDNHLQG
jgi:hypothetical protein